MSTTDTLASIKNDTVRTYSSQEASSELDADAFLQLLMVQLQNQDPLSPVDTTQFMAQQAQLTQVQEIQELNDNLTTMFNQMTQGNELEQSSSLIGKTVTVVDPDDSTKTISGVVSGANLYSDKTTVTIDGKEYNLYSVKNVKETES